MRWIKHLSNASDDEKTAALIEEFGPEGYGVWWLLLEAVSLSMGPKSSRCELTYSEGKWCQKLHVSTRKFRSLMQVMVKLHLISTESVDERVRICIPNLLKYRDEYSKKSGHTPDKLPNQTQHSTSEQKQSTSQQTEKPAGDAPVVEMPKRNSGEISPIEWRETFDTIFGMFSTAQPFAVVEVIKLAIGADPKITDAELAQAVGECVRPNQVHPGMFKHTLPTHLRERIKARDHPPPTKKPPRDIVVEDWAKQGASNWKPLRDNSQKE